MKYPKRSQYKYAKSPYRIRSWPEYEAGLRNPTKVGSGGRSRRIIYLEFDRVQRCQGDPPQGLRL